VVISCSSSGILKIFDVTAKRQSFKCSDEPGSGDRR
jgi:hypothetical protein